MSFYGWVRDTAGNLFGSSAYPINTKAGTGDLTNDAWGTLKVSNEVSIFHGVFTYDIPTSMWLVTEDGVEVPTATSTRVTSIAGRANVTSGATPTNKAVMETRRHPRYQPNKGAHWAGSCGFPDASLDGICKVGMLTNGESGVYFKTKGDGELYACITSAGVETHEELITFPFTIDITKGNVYDIQYQWRGVGNYKFFAGNPATGAIELVHTIEFLNTLDASLSIDNPAMSLGMSAENVSQEVSVWAGCFDVGSEGGQREKIQYAQHSVTQAINSPNPLTAIRSPLLIAGKVNTRDIELLRLSAFSTKKATIEVYRTRDLTLLTGGTWNTIQTGSYIEANDTLTAATVASMELFTTMKLQPNTYFSIDNPHPEAVELYLVHGDYLVFYLTSGTTPTIDLSVEWGDEI